MGPLSLSPESGRATEDYGEGIRAFAEKRPLNGMGADRS